jgi:hypothetical protein
VSRIVPDMCERAGRSRVVVAPDGGFPDALAA